MTGKIVLTIALFLFSLSSFQQDFTDINTRQVSAEEPKPAIEQLTVMPPPVESILSNPAVAKKQQSRNTLQAIGKREGAQTHFVIHFRKQQLHGDWQSFFANNQACDSGRLVKNLPDGIWKTWYANGRLKSIRTYDAEKFQYIKADLLRNHPKDQRYFITRYAREQKNIRQHFIPKYQPGEVSFPLTMLEKIQFNTTNDAGYIAPFNTCLHHGLFINYFENGLVKDSGNYVNGLKHELWEESSADGSVRAFGFYRHGIRHGHWKYYDAEGRIIYTEFFDENGNAGPRHYFRK